MRKVTRAKVVHYYTCDLSRTFLGPERSDLLCQIQSKSEIKLKIVTVSDLANNYNEYGVNIM